MKKLLLIVYITISTLTVNAQLWCSPNSVWHYDTSNPAFNTTYTKQTYLYDTLVLGTTFNKIKSETHGVGSSGPINSYGYYYTSLQNNVVFFNSTNSNIEANDTLMYFGPIGAKWRCWKNGGTSCAQSYIEIVDTGASVVQGQILKWRKINYTNYYMYGTANQVVQTGTDTIFERIGYKYLGFQFLWYCSDVVDVVPGYFRCFQDNQISLNATNKVCDFTTGLIKNTDYLNSISIYPNPTNSVINIEFLIFNSLQDNYILQITNLLGEVVQTIQITNQKTQLNLKQFTNGVYFITTTNTAGFSVTKKMIVN